MGIIDLILSFILFGLGLALLLYVGRMLLGPLLNALPGTSSTKAGPRAVRPNKSKSSLLEKMSKRISEAEDLIKEGEAEKALKIIRENLPILRSAKSKKLSEQDITKMRSNSERTLAAIVALEDLFESKAAQLPEIEHLSKERSELFNLLIKARISYKSIASRRKDAGKALPDWSKKDYEERIKEIEKELDKNEIALRASFAELLQTIGTASAQEVTYH